MVRRSNKVRTLTFMRATISEKEMVRPAGLEPATSRLEGECSIQLSYGRDAGETTLAIQPVQCLRVR